MGTPNDGSSGGRVAVGTCTGGVGFASVSALTRAGGYPSGRVRGTSARVLGPRRRVSSLDGFGEAIRDAGRLRGRWG